MCEKARRRSRRTGEKRVDVLARHMIDVGKFRRDLWRRGRALGLAGGRFRDDLNRAGDDVFLASAADWGNLGSQKESIIEPLFADISSQSCDVPCFSIIGALNS